MTFEQWWAEFAATLRADLSDDWRESIRTACWLAWGACVERCAAIAQSFDNGSDNLQRGSDGGEIADRIREGAP